MTITEQATSTPRVIDHGIHNRDFATGRFVATFTLRYASERNGVEAITQRQIPASGIETVGAVVASSARRGTVWDIEVLDKDGNDVTFEFACFQD